MKSNSHLKSTAIAVILAYGAAIATPVFAQSAPANPGCKNAGAAALVGGIFGAFLGGKDKATGAMIGAAISAIACMALEASSKQTQTSEQVLQEYKNQHDGAAPEKVTLVKYEGHAPTTVGRDGNGAVEVVSTGALVVPESQQQQAGQFTEELQLFIPGQKDPKVTSKPLSFVGGGGFEQSFKFAVNKQFPQGQYNYKTRILSPDNQVMGEKSGNIQVI